MFEVPSIQKAEAGDCLSPRVLGLGNQTKLHLKINKIKL